MKSFKDRGEEETKRKFKEVAYLVLFVVSLRAKARDSLLSSEDGNHLQLIKVSNTFVWGYDDYITLRPLLILLLFFD